MNHQDLARLLEHLNAGRPVVAGSDLHKLMIQYSNQAMRITAELNGAWHEPAEVRRLMMELTGNEIDDSFRLFPPFYTDFGKNIHIGKKVFINCGCSFQDQGGIYIEDKVLIGHKVVLATINHGLDPERRGDNYPAPIHIGRNVWIGANVTVLPGVTIGENAVIAAGAVVTKDVAKNTVVGGVPARFMKNIPAN